MFDEMDYSVENYNPPCWIGNGGQLQKRGFWINDPNAEYHERFLVIAWDFRGVVQQTGFSIWDSITGEFPLHADPKLVVYAHFDLEKMGFETIKKIALDIIKEVCEE
jgi:hypothetical protein